MKRVLLFLSVLAVFFTMTGCSAEKSRDNAIAENNADDSAVTEESVDEIEKQELLGRSIKWVSDVPLSEIKHIKRECILDVQSDMFITESGDLYLFSEDKLYSNNQVCKKVETDIKFDRFYSYTNDRDVSYIVGKDGKIYGYNEETKELYEPEHPYDFELELRELYPDLNTVWGGGHPTRHHIYYMDGNNLHKCTYVIVYGPEYGWAFEGDTIIDTLPEGETFISMDGRAIKSDKAYYEIGTVNSEEVDKYEDVEPIEGLVELTKLTEQYDNIYYFNGTFLVYKNDNENLYTCSYTNLK